MPRDEPALSVEEAKCDGIDADEVTQMDEAFELLSLLPGGGDQNSILDRAAAWFGVEKKRAGSASKFSKTFWMKIAIYTKVQIEMWRI